MRTKCALSFRHGCFTCLRISVLVKQTVQNWDFSSCAGFKWVSTTYNLVDQNQTSNDYIFFTDLNQMAHQGPEQRG
jgi:hypothetical protein